MDPSIDLIGSLAYSWSFESNSQLGYTPPSGTVESIHFGVRHDAFWQDGVQLNASDVKFSILSFRDGPSATMGRLVSSVAGVTVLSRFTFDVNLKAPGVFNLYDIGTVPIIPAHIWGSGGVCNSNSCTPDPNKASLTFDPVSSYAQ